MSEKSVRTQDSTIIGPKKAAILLVALGSQTSSKVFQQLHPDEVELLTKEISKLENVSSSVLQGVTQEFYQMVRAQEYIAAGGMDYAQEVLEKALGPDKAMDILHRIRRSLQVKGFNVLKEVDPNQLLSFIQKEHPQTIALVLTQIEPDQAASLLADLPIDLQEEVLFRFATMDSVSQDMVKEVETILESRIDFSQGGEKLGGVKPTAEILNMLGRSSEKKILESIAQEEPELATEIKNLMFVFEDIVLLDDRSIQRVLKEIDTQELTLALKAVSDDVKSRILQNMSQRAAEMIEEEMEFMGPVRLSEVESAQRQIIEVILRLDEEGEIVISSGTVADEIIE
ncbi:MAG: flagellar motor switch protein FliG [Candidatus Marinimicrobia bacterium]|nr:flagellar motor switch protein FliG [Candidatus Neomarinimicrobiota bacterium]MCF7880498.1 flagellar motor switch protein FliG [Candidatus Neomarinimicrobiota bacterium]